MNARENLAGALAGFVDLEPDEAVECSGSELLPIIAAAEERYDQLLKTCGTCGGDGAIPWKDGSFPYCPSCHGRGTVYPQATVERIVGVLNEGEPEPPFEVELLAMQILDALNSKDDE